MPSCPSRKSPGAKAYPPRGERKEKRRKGTQLESAGHEAGEALCAPDTDTWQPATDNADETIVLDFDYPRYNVDNVTVHQGTTANRVTKIELSSGGDYTTVWQASAPPDDTSHRYDAGVLRVNFPEVAAGTRKVRVTVNGGAVETPAVDAVELASLATIVYDASFNPTRTTFTLDAHNPAKATPIGLENVDVAVSGQDARGEDGLGCHFSRHSQLTTHNSQLFTHNSSLTTRFRSRFLFASGVASGRD